MVPTTPSQTTTTIIPTTITTTRITIKTVIEPELSKNCLPTMWDMREIKSLHREMVIWNQCSQWTISPERETRRTESSSTKRQSKMSKRQCSSCSSKIILKTPHFHSEAATDRPQTNTPALRLIPEVAWQQPSETPSRFTQKVQKRIETPTRSSKWNREMTKDHKRCQFVKYHPKNPPGSDTEPLLGYQTRTTPV